MDKQSSDALKCKLWNNKSFLQYAESTIFRGYDRYRSFQDIVDELLRKYPGFISESATYSLGIKKNDEESFIHDSAVDIFEERLRQQQLLELKSLFKRDAESADMKWSLFVCACQCYNYGSCVSPFPEWFLEDNGVKDIDTLLHVIEEIPGMNLVYKQLFEDEETIIKDENLALLHWLLIVNFKPHLQTMSSSQIEKYFANIQWKIPIEERPKYMFKIVYSSKSQEEQSWENFASLTGCKKITAYHATRLENIHSIIYNGITPYADRRTIYGQGIYLINELAVARRQSPYGHTWGGSRMGTEFACVCVCEFVDHPEMVKRQLTTECIIPKKIIKKEEVATKYFVISERNIIRLRYLLLFTRKPCPIPDEPIIETEDVVSKELLKHLKFERYNVNSESSEDSLLGKKIKKNITSTWSCTFLKILMFYICVLSVFLFLPPEVVKRNINFCIEELDIIYKRISNGKSYA